MVWYGRVSFGWASDDDFVAASGLVWYGMVWWYHTIWWYGTTIDDG